MQNPLITKKRKKRREVVIAPRRFPNIKLNDDYLTTTFVARPSTTTTYMPRATLSVRS